jgi:hypothetical protein
MATVMATVMDAPVIFELDGYVGYQLECHTTGDSTTGAVHSCILLESRSGGGDFVARTVHTVFRCDCTSDRKL